MSIVARTSSLGTPITKGRVGTLASEGWRAAIAQIPEGWTENRTVEGHWSLTGYSRTKHGWTAGVAKLEAEIAAPLSKIIWATTLLAGALSLLSITLGILIARHASRGMRALADAARELSQGRLVAAPPAPFAEAIAIGATLEHASEELNRRADLLSRANAELEARFAQRTAQLVAEMRRREETEKTLRQVHKMESIGQLTGGIAHDFNNLLTIIMGNLDTALRRMKSLDISQTATLNRPLEAALHGARNAAKLTGRLLAFARQQPLEPVPIDLNALVTSLADMLSRAVGEGIKIEMVSGAGLWRTFADANQIESSLLNIVVNARDAMPSGGKIIIETANIFLDDAYVARFGDLKAGQYVLLSVADTGSGIPSEMLERVVEPFFTTKEASKGTGLGLAIVHGFVKQSGGHMRIYSEVGEGTTIRIYLPRYMHTAREDIAAPRGAVADVQPVRLAATGETILLVEDDAGVREYAIGTLEDLGYRVLAAAEGTEALRVFGEAARVDLLFTDMVLGGTMTGRQLAEEIHKRRPSLPVLFTTGYTPDAIVHQGRLDAGVHPHASVYLLNKPYTQRDLAHKIRAAIEAQTNAQNQITK